MTFCFHSFCFGLAVVCVLQRVLTAEEAHQVLRALTAETCELLGFNPNFSRPDWLLTTVLPVPPPAVRPSIEMGGSGRRAEDDLTFKLTDILNVNQLLRRQEEQGANPQTLRDTEELLQFHLFTLVDNELAGDIPRVRCLCLCKVFSSLMRESS